MLDASTAGIGQGEKERERARERDSRGRGWKSAGMQDEREKASCGVLQCVLGLPRELLPQVWLVHGWCCCGQEGGRA